MNNNPIKDEVEVRAENDAERADADATKPIVHERRSSDHARQLAHMCRYALPASGLLGTCGVSCA